MLFPDAMLWIIENAWTLMLHLSGKSSFPNPLSAEEERELVEDMANGSDSARQLLIEHNLRLVAHIAKKYASSGVEADDLISIGSIGLMKAVETFRPEAGRLTTYASRCIENEILMHLRANRKNRSNICLNEPIGTDREGNEIKLIDMLGTDKDAVPDEAETKIESRRAIKLVAELLDEREKKVVTMRCGLDDGEPKPQHRVAEELGISRSYVSRIEKKAMEKLRNGMERSSISLKDVKTKHYK